MKKRVYWLILASFVIHFSNIGGYSIYALDEAKNATAAIEMWQSNEWILPTFNSEPRYDKPPLHYYAFSLAYYWFGISPFASRFFPALLGFCCIWLVYGFTNIALNKNSAFWAAFVLCCTPHWVIQFHMAVPDAFLIFFLTCSLLSFYTYLAREKKPIHLILMAYASLGLAVLSKGPVALVLTAGIKATPSQETRLPNHLPNSSGF
ncbi:ArnT family glycosyltransferase [Cyclobacterium roseum]|uniref:ArnT family glycosyltransferase n=1 Tax=Cyclobacterium roseum TaxID=2666137 RepID=UPI0013915C85|nr:glycosyltransferase family 39 protein [Cyclobacterium roseum]